MALGTTRTVGRPIWCLVAVMLMGCASPPSVAPLMRVVDDALNRERALLATDAQQHDRWYTQQRETLRRGFEADLRNQQAPDHKWMADHVAVYVAAREALLQAALGQRAASEQRIDNLRMASTAQRRALALIEQQDELFGHTPDLRRWWQERTTREQNP